MTLEEMERGLKGLEDNITVQGTMMYRLENNMDRLEHNMERLENNLEGLTSAVALNTEAIARNTEAIGRIMEVVVRHDGAIAKLTDGMSLMQAAMEKLFERMDRFIRGLESDGHKRGKKK